MGYMDPRPSPKVNTPAFLAPACTSEAALSVTQPQLYTVAVVTDRDDRDREVIAGHSPCHVGPGCGTK